MQAGLPLLNVRQHIIDRAGFWLALVLIEVGLQLLLCFVGVLEKFLARSEGQPANVAIGNARCCANESYNPEIAVGHRRYVNT